MSKKTFSRILRTTFSGRYGALVPIIKMDLAGAALAWTLRGKIKCFVLVILSGFAAKNFWRVLPAVVLRVWSLLIAPLLPMTAMTTDGLAVVVGLACAILAYILYPMARETVLSTRRRFGTVISDCASARFHLGMRNRICSPKRARSMLTATLGTCGAMGAAGGAHAQLIEQYFPSDIPGYTPNFSSSVIDRMNLQDQAEGVQVGDFVIRPQLSENGGYNSNVLGTSNSGSGVLETNASVDVNSNWAKNSFGAQVSVDNLHYTGLPSANYTNWTAGVGGAVSLGVDTISIAYSHLALNLLATDIGVTDVVTPVPYSVDDVRASYLKLFGRFNVTPSLRYENFAFGHSGGATAFINYDNLNHQTVNGTVPIRYEISPGDAAVMILSTTDAQYKFIPSDNYLDVGGFVGLDDRGESVIQYRALLGVESRSFQHSSAATVTIPTFQLDVVWTPTELDTVTATGVRRLDDPTSTFAQSQKIIDGRVELDHELRTNVSLTAYVEGAKSESQSHLPDVGSDNQTQLNLGASALWNINRHLRGTLSYGYSHSVSHNNSITTTAAHSGYSQFTGNTVMIGLSIFE